MIIIALSGVVLLIVVLCVVHYLRSPVRVQNATDWGHLRINQLDKINRWFCHHFHGLDARPLMLPESGGVVLVANHISGLDPLLLIAASRRPIRFLIARDQYERFGFTWFFNLLGCIPVDRTVRSQKAFYAARTALAAGEVVGVFPEGGIVTSKKPVNRLKRGAVLLADMAQAPIVAVQVDGVRGRGLTLLALFMPSKASLTTGNLLPYRTQDSDQSQTRGRTQRHQLMTQIIRPDITFH